MQMKKWISRLWTDSVDISEIEYKIDRIDRINPIFILIHGAIDYN